GLAIDQIAQSGLSSLSVIYYSAHLFRPEIRIYTTYLKALENEIDNHQFNDGKNYQVSFGVEGEVFW
ncbi:hypothetical protein, partial [Raoultella ornithinolytica]|uniref:hypothetical protein n=1 Tax=Raoultella ornithinolytica TaxID=54291 RepID=UPI00292B3B01